MICGPWYDLWVGLYSIPWLIAFAADELSRQGVPYHPERKRLKPNPSEVTGLHTWFEPGFNRWCFELAEDETLVGGGMRRSFHLDNLTPLLWSRTVQGTLLSGKLHDASPLQKREVALKFVTDWAAAIRNGIENEFLDANGLERGLGAQHTAPAAPEQAHASDADAADGGADAVAPTDEDVLWSALMGVDPDAYSCDADAVWDSV